MIIENNYSEIKKENRSLKYQLQSKDDEISNLKNTLSTKDRIINRLQTEKEKIQNELQKFKNFWHKIMKHFQNKIGFDKDEHYKNVSDDLYKNGIFTSDEFEIATNPARKIMFCIVRITEFSKKQQNRFIIYLVNCVLNKKRFELNL